MLDDETLNNFITPFKIVRVQKLPVLFLLRGEKLFFSEQC